jgi:hypothetical protein
LKIWVLRLCVLTGLAASSALAQTTATLNIRVLDQQQAAVAAAKVTIANPVTGLKREFDTGEDGAVQFANLPLHNYDLVVFRAGFKPDKRAVALRSNVPVNLEVVLSLEDQVTSVDVGVSTTMVLIDAQATGTRTELNAATFEKMPVAPAARGLESVLLSMPGFAANANGAIHPRGAHNQMTFVVDGIPISDQLTGGFANAVDPSVVENLELYTGNVPVEFGAKISGVAVVNTRSGIGSGRKFTGSTQVSAAQFDTLANLTQFSGGTEKFGYFASFNAQKSNRYLDQVSIDNLHNGGNSQRAFTRFDWQPNGKDVFRLNVMSGRSSFQLANLRSQHANLQNQRQQLEDVSIGTGWVRTLDARTTVEALASFRNAFAALLPSAGDTPVTASQSRRQTTWNLGARLNRLSGRHNIRGGLDYQRFPIREHFTFAITDPFFNAPASEDYNPSLLPYDLTRGGTHFSFGKQRAGSFYSAFVQDLVRFGDLQLSLGMRFDNYRFLVVGSQWQPRLGLSYHIKKTGTVIRASYNRTFQTPPNENLLMANSPESAVLAPPAVTEELDGAFQYIRPEKQDVYEVGVQQAIHNSVSVNASYYYKGSTNLQDNDNFFNTGIIFPTSLQKSRVNGAEGRVNFFPGRRFSASLSGTHYHVVVTPPFTGGLFLGSAAIDLLSAGPFVIDHDQKLGMQGTAVYNFTRSLWASLSIRYDSGLVSNPSDPVEVAQDPDYADLLPYVNLASDPARVRPRTITDVAVGYLHRRDGRSKWEAVAQVGNLFDRTALYNFQSIFVGTRLVQPRTASIRLRWFF